MSYDLVLRRCPVERVMAALASLDAAYPEVQITPGLDRPEPEPRRIGILDVEGIADLDIGPEATTVSGRGAAGPILAWLANELHSRAAMGEVWDPQAGAALADAPDWETVLDTLLMWELEGLADEAPPEEPGRDSLEMAAGFIGLLLERRLIELAPGDPAPLVLAVHAVLESPMPQRAEALDKLLMSHPGVDEVHGDPDDLARAVHDWG